MDPMILQIYIFCFPKILTIPAITNSHPLLLVTYAWARCWTSISWTKLQVWSPWWTPVWAHILDLMTLFINLLRIYNYL